MDSDTVTVNLNVSFPDKGGELTREGIERLLAHFAHQLKEFIMDQLAPIQAKAEALAAKVETLNTKSDLLIDGLTAARAQLATLVAQGTVDAASVAALDKTLSDALDSAAAQEAQDDAALNPPATGGDTGTGTTG